MLVYCWFLLLKIRSWCFRLWRMHVSHGIRLCSSDIPHIKCHYWCALNENVNTLFYSSAEFRSHNAIANSIKLRTHNNVDWQTWNKVPEIESKDLHVKLKDLFDRHFRDRVKIYRKEEWIHTHNTRARIRAKKEKEKKNILTAMFLHYSYC